jgi:ribonucleotide monophosphatase NagD (HAD superfamily)
MQIDSVSPGEIYFKGMHAYDSAEVEKWGSRDTMIKILSSHLVILKSLLLFKNKKILIIGESSLIDIFPKIDVKTAIGLLE